MTYNDIASSIINVVKVSNKPTTLLKKIVLNNEKLPLI